MSNKWHWEARAKYEDGTSVEKSFPYHENDNYLLEQERQYDLECWLIEQHDGCVWYSVECVEGA